MNVTVKAVRGLATWVSELEAWQEEGQLLGWGVPGDPSKASGSSGSLMNERVILGTSSRLYKAVEKEFSLPAREEGTLPAYWGWTFT